MADGEAPDRDGPERAGSRREGPERDVSGRERSERDASGREGPERDASNREGSGRGDPDRVRAEVERRRRLGDVFGEVLPESTSDDVDTDRAAPGRPADERWYTENRPPHHDRG